MGVQYETRGDHAGINKTGRAPAIIIVGYNFSATGCFCLFLFGSIRQPYECYYF